MSIKAARKWVPPRSHASTVLIGDPRYARIQLPSRNAELVSYGNKAKCKNRSKKTVHDEVWPGHVHEAEILTHTLCDGRLSTDVQIFVSNGIREIAGHPGPCQACALSFIRSSVSWSPCGASAYSATPAAVYSFDNQPGSARGPRPLQVKCHRGTSMQNRNQAYRDLRTADRRIAEGLYRIECQRRVVDKLNAEHMNSRDECALLTTLEASLDTMRAHRDAIIHALTRR
jgi:hypothetical protein